MLEPKRFRSTLSFFDLALKPTVARGILEKNGFDMQNDSWYSFLEASWTDKEELADQGIEYANAYAVLKKQLLTYIQNTKLFDLEDTSVEEFLLRTFEDHSDGERLRLVLALAGLPPQPKVLFLDEPFAGLETEFQAGKISSAYRVARYIENLAKSGMHVISVTHLDEAVLSGLYDEDPGVILTIKNASLRPFSNRYSGDVWITHAKEASWQQTHPDEVIEHAYDTISTLLSQNEEGTIRSGQRKKKKKEGELWPKIVYHLNQSAEIVSIAESANELHMQIERSLTFQQWHDLMRWYQQTFNRNIQRQLEKRVKKKSEEQFISAVDACHTHIMLGIQLLQTLPTLSDVSRYIVGPTLIEMLNQIYDRHQEYAFPESSHATRLHRCIPSWKQDIFSHVSLIPGCLDVPLGWDPEHAPELIAQYGTEPDASFLVLCMMVFSHQYQNSSKEWRRFFQLLLFARYSIPRRYSEKLSLIHI